uniref:Uncharacterized protein n=1 Tax=Ditylenchus dipsaci TaxID=166011 RepID=A0A915CT93_9BILA
MVQQSPELPTTPAPVALEQPAVTTTPSPMVVEPSITSPLPMKIQVTPSHLPPAGDFLHRKVVTPDNLANIKSQEHKDEENLPAPTPTIHPGTSTYPPGGRTASPQVNIDRLMNDLVGQIEEIKMAEPSVPPPQKTEEMEPTNDAVVQKVFLKEQPVIESEQKKDELLSQDPVHIAVEGEKQNVASELNEQSNMNADGIAKSKESYCHKEDCGNFENVLGQNTADPSSSNSSNLIAVRSALREFVDHLRDMLPYPLSQFDVTGIFVLIFVLVSLVLHFINMCCFYETGRDVVDQKLLHDCMTRLKEQELALKKYQADSVHYQKLSRAGEAAEQLHQEKQRLELEYHSSKEEYSELQRRHIELDRVHEQVQNKLKGKMQEVAEASAKVEQRDAEIEQLNRNLQILQSLNEVTANDLTSAKKELEQQKHDHDALQSIYKDSQLEVERLTYKWQCSEEELGRQRSRNEELQTQVDEFLNIIRELNSVNALNNHPENPLLQQEENGGSNGSRSGGWSDLGDDTPGNGDEETADDTTMTSSKTTTRVSKSSSGSSKITGRRNLLSSDLLELAHLKGELRKTEAERDTLRFSLENEQKEKEGLSQRLEQLKQDLAEKRKEAERREGERHDLQSQCTKLLHMVDERDRKVEHIEEEREKLRSKISQLEVDWRQTEDDKRELAVKNKIYHEERRLNAKVRMLEEQLNKAQSSVSPHNSGLGDLNMSGNSSDREFGPRVPLEVPSLWSDVEGPEMQFENVLYEMNRRPGGGTSNSLRQRNGGHQQRNSPALSNNNRTHGSSPFELEQIFGNKSNNSNSTMHTKEKRAPRARSRSTGRNSARLVGVDPDFKLDIKRSLLQK